MLCAWARCYSAGLLLLGASCTGLGVRYYMSVPVQSHVEDRGKDKTQKAHTKEKQNDEEAEVVEREEE